MWTSAPLTPRPQTRRRGPCAGARDPLDVCRTRGALAERALPSVMRMSDAWKLSLSIEARGHDDTRVGLVRAVGGGSPYLRVRTGGVVVHCLGPAAAMSAGEAWACARLASETWLPPLDNRRPVAPVPQLGAAYPSASVIFDGRQPWHVDQAGPAMSITIGPLKVLAYDITALDTHIRAWTEATAVATQLFPGKALPFARLVEHQRVAQVRASDQRPERRQPRPQVRRPDPPRRDGRGDDGPGRGRG